jgi:leader peptidase (prepilin peptidase)/N-methyltransferase
MLQANPTLLIGSVFLLSLLIGSFLNVVIHRLPIMLDRQWARPRLLGKASAPPAESYNLVVPAPPVTAAHRSSHQNIPSELPLLGRCAICGGSRHYPEVELATACYRRLGTLQLARQSRRCLTLALIALTVIDFDHQLLPDHHLPLLWLGLLRPGVARRSAADFR